ncbi:MAG: PaaI family thioesterase [Gammaproteobacteria bacterium]|nr:PaaI family thioesterase [Gammaproteobacteria bacterium]
MEHPFADLIGLEMEQREAGSSTCALTVEEKLLNPHRVVHGGVLYSMADTGMGAALYPLLSEGELCATIEIKINYFAPVQEGRVVCETKLVNKGRTVANLESEVRCGDRVVARANGNYAIFTPRRRL